MTSESSDVFIDVETGLAEPCLICFPEHDIPVADDRWETANPSLEPYTLCELPPPEKINGKLEDMMDYRKDRLLDRWTAKDVRMATGGMTVWYMIEALAMTETCRKIAREMRSTREYQDTLSSEKITEMEGKLDAKNYDLTFHEWCTLHGIYHEKIIRHLDIPSDHIIKLNPWVVWNEWEKIRDRYA